MRLGDEHHLGSPSESPLCYRQVTNALKLFATYLHPVHVALTIRGGYYSRDHARWEEGSARPLNWFHTSGGNLASDISSRFAVGACPETDSRGGRQISGSTRKDAS